MLFQDLRFDADGNQKKDFPLNQLLCKVQKSLWLAAISAAAPRARQRSTHCTIWHPVRYRAVVRGHLFSELSQERAIACGRFRNRSRRYRSSRVLPSRPVTIDLERRTIVCGDRTTPLKSIRSAVTNCSMAGTMWTSPRATEIKSSDFRLSIARASLGQCPHEPVLRSADQLSGSRFPRQAPNGRSQQAIARQITRCRRPRYARRRTACRKQVGKSRSVLTFHSAS